MDIRLITFLEVCHQLNYTKAANNLNMTQPGVSQHIRSLERFYDKKLFYFEGKRCFLTEAGTFLYQFAMSMQQNEAYLLSRMKTIGTDQRMLNFGATLSIGEYVMPKVLENYLTSAPNTKIRMIIDNTKELLELLWEGDIDFAIVEGNFDQSKFDSSVYSEERFIPICGKNELFDPSTETVEDLLDRRIIVREKGSGTREILERNLENLNLSIEDFDGVMEVGGMNAIKSLVESHLGISFLYEVAVKKELEAGSLKKIPLKNFDISHKFAFVWNKETQYLDHLKTVFEQIKTSSQI